MRIALIHEVFHDDPGGERLSATLADARRMEADLAVLPELPLNDWCPADRVPAEEDAEPPDGRRRRTLATAVRTTGLPCLGGAIVRDPATGKRHNAALLLGSGGELLADYRKLHLPSEDGFWEDAHYEPGDRPPEIVPFSDWRIGLQLCSDVNRPQGSLLLGAMGAELILAPRATPPETWRRWRLVLRANAITAALFVVSVNRPRPERGAPLGGPSIAIAPDGEVLAETTDPLTIVTLDRARLAAARRAYPGYLAVRSDLYARGWSSAPTRELDAGGPTEAGARPSAGSDRLGLVDRT